LTSALETRRLVTLTGATGCGLSSLAQAVGEKSASTFRAGAWWVPLPPNSDPSLQAALTAFSLGLRGRGSGVIPELIERIGARQMLLVFDGIPAGAGGGSLPVDLLRACPNLRVLATARSALHAPGELVVTVPPMGGPPDDPAHLDPAKLFLDHLTSLEAAPWKEKPSDTVRLCNLLKGNPLAINLAAGLAPTMTPAQFEAQLRQRVQLVGSADLESISADRLVQVLVSWAFDGQPVGTLAVLLRASVFVSAWSLRAMRAVGGSSDAMPSANPDPLPTPAELRIADQLERLVKAGLVRRTFRTDDPVRACLMLPDAVRREAAARLGATPGAATLVQNGYTSFANALAALAAGPMTAPVAYLLESHYPELVSAAARGADAPRIEVAQQALFRFHGLA
jgi:hypothetical protein